MDAITLFFIALIIFVAGFTGLAIYSQIQEYQLKKLKLMNEQKRLNNSNENRKRDPYDEK